LPQRKLALKHCRGKAKTWLPSHKQKSWNAVSFPERKTGKKEKVKEEQDPLPETQFAEISHGEEIAPKEGQSLRQGPLLEAQMTQSRPEEKGILMRGPVPPLRVIGSVGVARPGHMSRVRPGTSKEVEILRHYVQMG